MDVQIGERESGVGGDASVVVEERDQPLLPTPQDQDGQLGLPLNDFRQPKFLGLGSLDAGGDALDDAVSWAQPLNTHEVVGDQRKLELGPCDRGREWRNGLSHVSTIGPAPRSTNAT